MSAKTIQGKESSNIICTESYKRKLIPKYSDYQCYTTCKQGQYILMNGSGDVLYYFKDENEKKENAQSIIDSIFRLYRIKYDEYENHYRENPQYYIKTYEEANWVHRLLYKGFKEVGHSGSIDPYLNWYGCSLYSPDRCLGKQNKKIFLSLQGMYMRLDGDVLKITEKY